MGAAARAAALLAWSFQRAGDRVGALVCSASRICTLPPAGRESHLTRILGEISRATRADGPAPVDQMVESLMRLRQQVRAGSSVFEICMAALRCTHVGITSLLLWLMFT